MTEKPIKYLNHLDNIEYSFFDEDPDGEEDRAGDGWYFRIDGDDGWSGAWQSETEAMDEAKDALTYRERMAIEAEMTAAGFKKKYENENDFFEKADGDVACKIQIEENTVTLTTARGDESHSVSFNIGEEGSGYTHLAVREAKREAQAFIDSSNEQAVQP